MILQCNPGGLSLP
ncbi:hypothetical protein E2C01_071230 [Portunus trituberculatus]|uniref:Uncharacterized protein n=1 Tax=Portunus trituberculatus TaxID=210409 RepID=A0A5B7I7F9_PORTR|nr:hypothetical protein [Portunus trituberculatus]